MPSLELAKSKKKKRSFSRSWGKLFWGILLLFALLPWAYPTWNFFQDSASQEFLALRKRANLLKTEAERISFYSHAIKQYEENPTLREKIFQEIQEIKKEEDALLSGALAHITRLIQRQQIEEALRICLELEKTLSRESLLSRKKSILDSFLTHITPQAQKIAYLEVMGEKDEAAARLQKWTQNLPPSLKEKMQQEYAQALVRHAHQRK